MGGQAAASGPAITTDNSPIPSITTTTSIPAFTGAAPSEVPQAMTSPGFSVMSWDKRLTISGGDRIMSLAG